MPHLIDISGHQSGLNLEAIKPDNGAVIVKAVAAYKPEHTVADGYQDNIDRVIAAGLPKGHYLVVNSQNTPEVSAKFLAENAHRYSGGDVLALDNEPLDTYRTFWKDADTARFFRALHAELGHPYERMWLYCPAHLTRTNGPWTETLALGVKVWWVSYGDNDPLLEDGEEPLLGGGVTRWDVHQFTSTYRVAGYAGNLDRNFTPHPITDLFGGVDVGYLEARPAKGNMNQGFGPRPKPTPTSPAIHYGQDYGWGGGDAIYAARGGTVKSVAAAGAYGLRVVIDHGGGRETWYCHLASSHVRVGDVVAAGQHIAEMGASGNVTAKHLHFELRIDGIATDPAPHFDGASTAGGGTTPIGNTPVPEEDEDMKKPYTRIQAEGRGIALIAPGYYRHLMNPTEVEISAGFVDRHETVNDAQFDYLVAISIQGTSANSAAEVDVLERIKNLSVKAEIPADFAAQVAEGTAAAVESKLADDFAAIDAAQAGITADEAEVAAERAVRRVLGDAAQA